MARGRGSDALSMRTLGPDMDPVGWYAWWQELDPELRAQYKFPKRLDYLQAAEWNLDQAQLSGVSLHGANLSNTSLVNAALTGADLGSTQLQGADFTGAVLTDASLRGAEAAGTDFSQTTCDGAAFDHADVDRAKFMGATGVIMPASAQGNPIGVNSVTLEITGPVPAALLSYSKCLKHFSGLSLKEVKDLVSNQEANQILQLPVSAHKIDDLRMELAGLEAILNVKRLDTQEEWPHQDLSVTEETYELYSSREITEPIKAIKQIRALASKTNGELLTLKEAKELVDSIKEDQKITLHIEYPRLPEKLAALGELKKLGIEHG